MRDFVDQPICGFCYSVDHLICYRILFDILFEILFRIIIVVLFVMWCMWDKKVIGNVLMMQAKYYLR